MSSSKSHATLESFSVGAAEIAERLGVRPQTVHTWRQRDVMSEPRWTVSGQPAWDWTGRRRSAWIELLRGTGHPAHRTLKHHLGAGSPIATTEVIVLELLAGASSKRDRLRQRLLALPQLRLRGMPDFEAAADLYRQCRRAGSTVRKLIDCLIAAVALRERATVLHNDRDFEVLSRHARLRVEPFLD